MGELMCGCGYRFAEALGAFGCPNCEGDNGPATEDMFYLIVAGSRGYTDYPAFCQALDAFIQNTLPHRNVVIVSGGAKGVDRMAERYAHERQYTLMVVLANWDKYGKRAGMVRNEEMGTIADGLVAFWDGESRGTRHMIAHMKQLGKPTKTIKVTNAC